MEESCILSGVTQLVLDEADRMLDMGFIEDMKYLISQCAPTIPSDDSKLKIGRQTSMFSATWPESVRRIALEFMNENPVRVYVGFEFKKTKKSKDNGEDKSNNADDDDDNSEDGIMVDDSLRANVRVEQNVEVIEDREREARLRQLLKQYPPSNNKKKPFRVLVFGLYKMEVARLEANLKRTCGDGLVNSIHGNKNQRDRTSALESFKDGSCPLLVATDVAARGLDVPNVELVINYTFPLTIEDYVHRIGRTGRAGKSGISYTFFQTCDKSMAGELQNVLRGASQKVPEDLLAFGCAVKKKEHGLYGNFGPKGPPMKKAVKITFDNYDD